MKRTAGTRGSWIVIIGAVLLSANLLHAQSTWTWTGNDSSDLWSWWNNWNPNNTDPGSYGIKAFDAAGTYNVNNDGEETADHRWYFGSGAGTYTLSGTAVQLSDYSGNDPEIKNDSSNTQTININLTGDGDSGDLLQIGANSGDLVFGGTVNNNGSAIRVYSTGGNDVYFNGVVSGSGALTVDGNTIVHLGAANTFSGTVNLNAGEVQLDASGVIDNNVDVSVASGATFDLNNFNETIDSLSLASGGSLSLGTGDLTVDNQDDGTWAGTISGSAGSAITRIKNSGTLSLTGNNSFDGDFYVDGGTVGFNHNNAVGSAGTIHVGVSGGAFNSTIDISVNGVSVGADIVVESGAGSRTIDQAVGSGSVTFSGDITLNKEVNVTAGSGETLVLSGVISGGNKLIKGGDGTVTLSGNSTYTGNTEIDAGTLNVAGDLSGSSDVYVGNGGNSSDATLTLSGSGAGLGNVTVNTTAGSGSRNISVSAGSHTIAGTTTVNRDTTITASGGSLDMAGTIDLDQASDFDLNINAGSGSVTLSGAITADTGASQINKSGSGTLTISGNNSSSFYMLNISGGTVAISGTSALGSQTGSYTDKVNFNSSGTLQITGNLTTDSDTGFRVANGQTGTFSVNNGVTFSVSGATALSVISGSGTFAKSGAGTMQINGNVSYSGTFNMNAGTLDVQGGLTASSGVNVNGGTLKGDGTVGSLVIGSGGVLSPGNSPGTISAGSTTWAGGGSYLWEINDVDAGAGSDPGWDLLDVTGTLTITATAGNEFIIDITSLTLANASGNVHDFVTTTSYTWVIAQASGGISGFNASDFTLDTSGFSNPNSGQWAIQQNGNTIEIVYTGGAAQSGSSAVPEPDSLLLLAAASVVTLSLRRQRKLIRQKQAGATAR